MEFFNDVTEDIYDTTFDNMYDTLVDQYMSGELTISTLERNIKEQQMVYMNAFYEGETKSAYHNAVIDAHQYVLSMIQNGKIKREGK